MTVEFARFLLTGGVAAVVNLVSRYVLNLAVPFELAVVLAYILGMITAYLLFRSFVFEASEQSVAGEVSRFTVVNLLALALVWAVSIGLARIVFPSVGFAWHAEDLAHVIGVSAPAVTSYYGHRAFTFARRQ